MDTHIKSLRPYQNRACVDTYAALREADRIMLQLPTGAGKTHIATAIIEHGIQHGKRIGFIVDRLTLADQVTERLWEHQIPFGVVQGDDPSFNPSAPVQICSVQTLARRGRNAWPPCDLYFVDEAHCHYSVFNDMAELWPHSKWVGLSATPFTTGLGLFWQHLVVGSTVTELMDLGFLSQYVAYGPSAPDLSNIRYSNGDYSPTDLEERMTEITGDVVDHYVKMAAGKKALAFTPTVAYAEYLAAAFRDAGIEADFVCGKDSDDRRADVLARYKSGEIKVLTNCEVLTKGYDQPDIEVGILARPTRSLSLHIQMIGRLIRTAPGKEHALILDHAGNIARLGFPDDDLPQELNMQESGVSTTDRPDRDEPEPWTCSQCKGIVPPRNRSCTHCGFTPQRSNDVEVKSGVLERLEKSGHADKQSVYAMLHTFAMRRGYATGWVSHKYREIFGVWPRGVKPYMKEPSQELLGWIQHQQIKYAKRREQ
jgi:superfamily II DNA or RNA helicase